MLLSGMAKLQVAPGMDGGSSMGKLYPLRGSPVGHFLGIMLALVP